MSNTVQDRTTADQILDRIASDIDFQKGLAEDPSTALKQAGIKLENTRDDDDVRGYGVTDDVQPTPADTVYNCDPQKDPAGGSIRTGMPAPVGTAMPSGETKVSPTDPAEGGNVNW